MNRKILMMMALVLFFGTTTIAQEEHDNAIPENGFWEVITNAAHPRSGTVRFYDLQMHLISAVSTAGVLLLAHPPGKAGGGRDRPDNCTNMEKSLWGKLWALEACFCCR